MIAQIEGTVVSVGANWLVVAVEVGLRARALPA